jgi:hypothetical protein
MIGTLFSLVLFRLEISAMHMGASMDNLNRPQSEKYLKCILEGAQACAALIKFSVRSQKNCGNLEKTRL